jgi:hypothetical protein
MHVCQLLWIKLTHHQELAPFVFDPRIVGPIQSCQIVHQD